MKELEEERKSIRVFKRERGISIGRGRTGESVQVDIQYRSDVLSDEVPPSLVVEGDDS